MISKQFNKKLYQVGREIQILFVLDAADGIPIFLFQN